MKLRLAPGKVAVKKIEAKLKGGLALPVTRAKAYDIAEITCVGDLSAYGYRREESTAEQIKPGQIVLFQLPMSIAGMTSHKIKDTLSLILNVGDIVALLDSATIELSSFHIAGRFVLLKASIRQQSKLIVVPDTAEEMNKESLHFSVLQRGKDVKLDIFDGQEVYPNKARINPLVVDNEEVCFVDQQFIDGALYPE